MVGAVVSMLNKVIGDVVSSLDTAFNNVSGGLNHIDGLVETHGTTQESMGSHSCSA